MTTTALARSATHEHPWPHRYSMVVAAVTLLAVTAGGLVTSTGSGYASPEPVLMDRFQGTGLFEHSHRVLAWIVGTLVLGSVVLFGAVEKRTWVRRLTIGALAAVAAQGALGIFTVKLKLPPQVSIAHAALAEITFALVVAIALVTSSTWGTPPVAGQDLDKTRRRALATMVVVYLQVLIGAWYRHTSSPLALWAHILWVIVVGIHVMMMKHSRALLGLFMLQLVMGPIALMFTKGKVIHAVGEAPESLAHAVPITIHVAFGALMFAASVVCFLMAARDSRQASAQVAAS